MSEPRQSSPLEAQIACFLDSLRRENVSAHTLRAYAVDLEQFAGYLAFTEHVADKLDSMDRRPVRAKSESRVPPAKAGRPAIVLPVPGA